MSDQTTATIAIKDENGMVMLEFPKPIRWCELDSETARQVGEAIAKAAYKARYGMNPPDGSRIAADKRLHLVTRVAHVIRQLNERGRSPKYSAEQIVDIVLAGMS